MKKSVYASLWAAWRPISGRLVCVLTAAFLISCSAMSTQPLPVAKVPAPEQCLASPEPLPLLADPSMEGLLRHLVLVAGEWHSLNAKHSCLAEFDRLR